MVSRSLLCCACALLLAASSALAAEAPPGDAAAAAIRAAEAAQRAAEAAQRAAEAAQRAAEGLSLAQGAVAPGAPATLPGAIPAPAPAPSPRWTGSAGLGLISITGNARSTTFVGTATGERKSATWIYGLKAFSAYGRARSSTTRIDETNALNAGVQLRADRRLTPLVAVYGLAGAEADHVKSVEYRVLGEPGVSLIWLDRVVGERKSFVRTDLGVRYQFDSRYNYYPTAFDVSDEHLVAPRLGASLRYGISDDLSFVEDFEVLTNVIEESRTLVSSVTRLVARLTRAVQVGTGFTVNHDSNPAPGKVPTDTILSATVELVF